MELLGPVELWRGTERVEITAGKVRGVVAVLALQAGRAVAATTILDTLWGDDPPDSATNAVQVYASTIRRALRAAGDGNPRRTLTSSKAGYQLIVDAESVDGLRFERLLSAGTAALEQDDPALADQHLAAALACWSGDRALADVDEEFVMSLRTRFDELRVMAQERSVDARLALGGTTELVPELESLVAAHPYRESLWERLMLALYRSGRQRDALQALQRARCVLLEDLGIEPGPGLVAMESAMLRQDPTLAAPTRQPTASAPAQRGGVGTSEQSKGRHRTIVGLSSLPGSLVGRADDLASLRAAIGSDDVRIVTLTGPGGVGKTRLSVALATEALKDFDPVVFVDLAATTDGSDVAPALASILGIPSGNDPIAAVADRLDGARAFIVLDNLEQVGGAAPAVAALSTRLPSLKFLATSRSPLRFAAEHEHRVRPLALEDARELFAMRAQAQMRNVDDGEPSSLDRICARLDCLPLALELAAARVRLLALDALEARLERYGFAALGRGGADTPARHQSLGATIAWSVDLLDADVRHVYECLGCFQGGATLDAIEAVVQPGDPMALLDALDLLVDASLLPAPDLHGSVPRFRLLETIRQDAAGRADARPDAAVLHRRHAEHFAAVFARGARVGVEDLPNLRIAFARLLDADDAEAAAQLAISGRRVWFDAGALTEMRDLYSRIVDLQLDTLTRARAAILAGCLGYVIGRLRDTAQLEGAIATLRDAGDFDPIAINAFCYLGSMALDRGAVAEADSWAEQAIEWAQRSDDVEGESIALDFSAYVARNARDFQRAADLMARAVEIARRRAAPADLSQRLSSLSFAMGALGAHEAARAAALEALELARAVRARPAERDALGALGEAVLPTDVGAAIRHLGRAVAMSAELGQEALEELTRFARALNVGGDAEHAALITGVALARQRASAVDDPEGAEIRAQLEAELDPAGVARGAALQPDTLLGVVAEVLSSHATDGT